MNKLIDLKDLLKHEILDMYSAKKQLIDNLPGMIEHANKSELKSALGDLLAKSKIHLTSLDSIKGILGDRYEESKTGFFSSLFGGSNSIMSRGVEGLIKEANKLMNEEMTSEVTDAAIIGSIQKINHYAIAGYGTVRAYASELKYTEIVSMLETTLKDEYDTDKSLTKLAVGSVNIDAENAVDKVTNNDADYDRLTNSISIMNSSDGSDY